MITVDVQRSTVVIDGRHFPAVIVRDPLVSWWWSGPYPEGEPSNCLHKDGFTVSIPAENGALIEVSQDDDGITLSTVLPVWGPVLENPDDLELVRLRAEGRRLVISEPSHRCSIWTECEEEWVAEQIDRLSVMQCDPLPAGRRAGLFPLSAYPKPWPLTA